jgi:hypothetical protein
VEVITTVVLLLCIPGVYFLGRRREALNGLEIPLAIAFLGLLVGNTQNRAVLEFLSVPCISIMVILGIWRLRKGGGKMAVRRQVKRGEKNE